MRPDRSTTRDRYPEAFPDYSERPVPLLSVSASTPLPGEPQQPLQYFVPTHKLAPPPSGILPPPTGLNLSSYSFLLMEKRDREREAMERANRGYLADTLSDKKDSHRDEGYNHSPRMSSGSQAYPEYPSESPHARPSDRFPPGPYEDYYRPHPSDRQDRYSHPQQHGPYYPPTQYGPDPYPPSGHHYHSSSSANIGDPYSHHRPTQVRSHTMSCCWWVKKGRRKKKVYCWFFDVHVSFPFVYIIFLSQHLFFWVRLFPLFLFRSFLLLSAFLTFHTSHIVRSISPRLQLTAIRILKIIV